MRIDDKIEDEKIEYDINRKAAKISVLSSGKINKYKYVRSEEILPTNQKQIIEQAKFTYSQHQKAFEKQTKTIEDQGEKQIKPAEEHEKQSAESNALIEKYNYDTKKDQFYNKREGLMSLLVKQ